MADLLGLKLDPNGKLRNRSEILKLRNFPKLARDLEIPARVFTVNYYVLTVNPQGIFIIF